MTTGAHLPSDTADKLFVERLLLANTVGLSILAETFRSAAYFASRSDVMVGDYESKECFMFVQGTGLDLLLQYYHLNYDPHVLRGQFNYYLKRRSNGHF